ncbi:rhodanese-like domain-containing protein [Pseudodesulfovibrio senegalensis]|jgi:rhodanese-related sulfurtransferase|uniref:Rhodanese-like domain-containing protein n=1 Tax=Pseudodesulfovibrio senegalensis TaxID=1721087 RepID=A0A6N6N5H4_9BACT|nr:rhodanese-like domain-containing protein [Pseudodesulfovibrio senegalensis]KAB1443432.1 rhodanese-like domain-containing protein [Pseudodesulfovibrio senegalensis]
MIKTLLKETILVMGLSLVFAAGSYAVRPHGFPQVNRPTAIKLPESVTTLDAKQAKAAHECEHNLFVDSRNSFDFDLGHIPGAINIPLDEAITDDSVLDTLPKQKRLVVYCSNIKCQWAEKLASLLDKKGYTTYVFPGGYKEWTKQGWATEGAQ